jgi:hypothetical protein
MPGHAERLRERGGSVASSIVSNDAFNALDPVR